MGVHLRCKVAVLGDAAVGKTAMVQMVHSKSSNFPRNYRMTSGADLVVAPIPVPEAPGSTVHLHIFDIGGQEIFRETVFKYLDNVSMVLLAYDTTNLKSFENCDKWLELLKKSRGDRQIPGALVGCKSDLESRKAVTTEQALAFAQANGLSHFECSAAPPGQHVVEPFNLLGSQFYRAYEDMLERVKR